MIQSHCKKKQHSCTYKHEKRAQVQCYRSWWPTLIFSHRSVPCACMAVLFNETWERKRKRKSETKSLIIIKSHEKKTFSWNQRTMNVNSYRYELWIIRTSKNRIIPGKQSSRDFKQRRKKEHGITNSLCCAFFWNIFFPSIICFIRLDAVLDFSGFLRIAPFLFSLQIRFYVHRKWITFSVAFFPAFIFHEFHCEFISAGKN